MVGWIILGVLVLIIVLINMIPVGVDLGYENGKLHLSAKVAWILLRLFPRRRREDKPPKEKKPKKAKKQKKPKEEAEEKPKRKLKLSFTPEEILELLRAVLKGAGRFRKDLKVDRFVLHFVAAGQDPYNVAMTYAYVNAGLSSLAPLCKKLTVRNSDVWTDVDFTADWFHLDLALAMTIRIGQIVGMSFSVAFGVLKIFLRNRRRLKKEAKEAAGTAPAETENIEQTESTIQEEERMAANG